MSNETASHRSLLSYAGSARGLILFVALVCAVAVFAQRPQALLNLVVAAAFILALSSLREWWILILYALTAFSVEIDFSGGTHAITLPTEALIPILFLTTLLTFLVTGRFRYIHSPLHVVVILYVLVMYASLLTTWRPVLTVKAIVRDSGYIFAGYVLLQRFVTDRRRLIILLWSCAVVQMILVMYGFGTQAVGGIRIYDDIAYPFFENHCIYAAFLVITLAFLIAFGLGYLRGIWATVVNVMALVVAAAVALTFVRAAWISVVFMLVYLLFHFRRRAASVHLLLVSLVLNLLAVAVVLSTDIGRLFIQRMQTVTDTDYVANYDRLDRWLSALHMWRDEPIHGFGYGAYPDVYFAYVVYHTAYSSHLRMGAHNLYFEILAETGLIGLSAFLLMLIVFFREATIRDPGDRDPFVSCVLAGAKAAMISFLVHAFFNNLGPSDKIGISFWLLLSMVPCCARLAEQSLGEAWDKKPVAGGPQVLVSVPMPAPTASADGGASLE
jgi:O-antigen ligase